MTKEELKKKTELKKNLETFLQIINAMKLQRYIKWDEVKKVQDMVKEVK